MSDGLMNIGCRVYQGVLSDRGEVVMNERVWVGLTSGDSGGHRKCILAKPTSTGAYEPSSMMVVPYSGVGPLGWNAPLGDAIKVVQCSIRAAIVKHEDEISVLKQQLEKFDKSTV